MTRISVRVDDVSYTDEVEPRMLLVHYLRETVGKTGTVVGCDTSNCGACTVDLDQAHERCELHAWLAGCDDFIRLIDEDWLRVADWYRGHVVDGSDDGR